MQDQAQWPEIIACLNPLDDVEIRRLVLVLRGPHMFVPGVALNILKGECESLARCSTSSSIGVALQAAVRSIKHTGLVIDCRQRKRTGQGPFFLTIHCRNRDKP